MPSITGQSVEQVEAGEARELSVEREQRGSWCIWTKTGRRPSFFHETQEQAERQAERLAAATPGKKFIVMQVVSKFGLPQPTKQPAEQAS